MLELFSSSIGEWFLSVRFKVLVQNAVEVFDFALQLSSCRSHQFQFQEAFPRLECILRLFLIPFPNIEKNLIFAGKGNIVLYSAGIFSE